MYIYICIYIYKYIHTYVHTYIHTYMSVFSQPTTESPVVLLSAVFAGYENPAGLVALPCRKRRSIWNFQHCCGPSARSHVAMSDEEVEE